MLKLFGFKATIKKELYPNRTTHLQAFTETGSPLCTITVNLADYGYIPPENHAYIKIGQENTGILEPLVEQNIISAPLSTVNYGYMNSCTAVLCKILI
ncbi:hypothetical protein [Chroococcus sp. FPU101]|uniref:hypothetical protein n=1 Tax=Chroococcus sp. FPU101 TaxID=1974212 RepID=UPI001A909080|nr:hypothetical protein [Chroococcus sp. FPU101]GFE69039.1 hypothetical protein CFPU101_16490 [Chroococcus sp. FPU101]